MGIRNDMSPVRRVPYTMTTLLGIRNVLLLDSRCIILRITTVDLALDPASAEMEQIKLTEQLAIKMAQHPF